MTKTINCAECEVEFTFEENPRFPRKYCLKCSANKKAMFQASQVPKGAPRPDLEEDDVEVVRVADAVFKDTVMNQNKYLKKDNGFHLTPEQCRSNALASAIEWAKFNEIADVTIMELAKTFEKYILTGE